MSDEAYLQEYKEKIHELQRQLTVKNEEVLSVHQLIEEQRSQLVELKEKVSQMEKLEGEFVSNISHELGTPLTSLLQGLELMLDETLGSINPKQREILDVIHTECKRFNRLIQDIIMISRIQFGKVTLVREITDIISCVKEFAQPFIPLAEEKGLAFNSILPEKPIYASIDRKRIGQIIFNLLENAVKFTEEGNITVAVTLQNREVHMIVEDTGRGIDPEDKDKLFKKFQQFSRQVGGGAKGTGLGLAICRGIAQLHKGDIWVQLEKGKGVRFIVSLPVAIPRILIADDVQDITLILETKLQREGIRTDTAVNVAQIKERVENADYSVILLDLTLDGLDHSQLIAQVREMYAGPIIIFSARSEDELVSIVQETKVEGFVRKPFEFEDLLAKIKCYSQ